LDIDTNPRDSTVATNECHHGLMLSVSLQRQQYLQVTYFCISLHYLSIYLTGTSWAVPCTVPML